MVGHGAGHSGRRALARRLAMKAPCSVWMVPDGSPAASAAFWRRSISRRTRPTRCKSLCRLRGPAARPACRCTSTSTRPSSRTRNTTRCSAARSGQPTTSSSPRSTARGVELSPHFEEGANVAHAIERVAEREAADLIVMGTRGRSRSAAILLGSVTEANADRNPPAAPRRQALRRTNGRPGGPARPRLSLSQRAAYGLAAVGNALCVGSGFRVRGSGFGVQAHREGEAPAEPLCRERPLWRSGLRSRITKPRPMVGVMGPRTFNLQASRTAAGTASRIAP